MHIYIILVIIYLVIFLNYLLIFNKIELFHQINKLSNSLLKSEILSSQYIYIYI